MLVCIILLVVGFVCLGLFLIEKIRRYSIKETVIKAITSCIFIALAIYSNVQNGGHPIGVFFIIGLSCGLIGDIALDLKYVYKEQSRPYTYTGFISFAIGHIFYMIGMFKYLPYPRDWYSYVVPFAIGIVGGLLVILLEKPLKMKYGEYKFICWLYGTILFSMTAVTGYIAIRNQLQITALNMLFIAGILFAVSDLILSGTYFAEGKERPIDIVSNGITYYVAQYLIAFSLFFI